VGSEVGKIDAVVGIVEGKADKGKLGDDESEIS
jgi:hypothetical protein